MPCVLQLQSSQLQVTDAALCHELDLRNIKVRAYLKFLVSGRSKQAIKQSSKHTHACAQWSHASVGLAQARPNYFSLGALSKRKDCSGAVSISNKCTSEWYSKANRKCAYIPRAVYTSTPANLPDPPFDFRGSGSETAPLSPPHNVMYTVDSQSDTVLK